MVLEIGIAELHPSRIKSYSEPAGYSEKTRAVAVKFEKIRTKGFQNSRIPGRGIFIFKFASFARASLTH